MVVRRINIFRRKERGMKLKVIEIEATAEDLKASNTMAQNFSRLLTQAFAPASDCETNEVDEE